MACSWEEGVDGGVACLSDCCLACLAVDWLVVRLVDCLVGWLFCRSGLNPDERANGSVSVSVSAQDGMVGLRKALALSAPSLSSLPKVVLETMSMLIWLNTDRSRPRGGGGGGGCGMSAAAFLHSSFLQAINCLPIFRKFLKPLNTSALPSCRTRCDVCCVWQSVCPFIPTDSSMPRAVDPRFQWDHRLLPEPLSAPRTFVYSQNLCPLPEPLSARRTFVCSLWPKWMQEDKC